MIPFIIAGAIGYGIAKLLEKDNTEKFAKGGQAGEIESMKSMMQSLYTYGGIEKGSYGFNKYLSKYMDILGEKLFNKTYNEELKRLQEYEVVQNVHTDSKGLTYNSLKRKFDEGGETFMAGGMTNEDILRSFLTSNRETQTNNLATFYSTLGAVMLLRNYGTLIAKRNGRRVEITNVKHSKTTSAITNRLKALAEQMGYNVSYVSEFSEGGEAEEDESGIIQEQLNELVEDFSSDEYKAFCYEHDIDEEDAVEMVNFIYSQTNNRCKKIIQEIEDGYYAGGYDDDDYEYADGGEAGSFSYDYYEVYDESTGKSLMIYAIDQEDAESIAEELDFESFEDGDEYNPNEDEYAGYMVFNYTDDIYATDEVFKTKKIANDFIKKFRSRFSKQGYYRDNQMNKIDVQDIDLLVIPSDFNPFGKAI